MQMKFYSPLTADFFPNDTEDLGDDYSEYEGIPYTGKELTGYRDVIRDAIYEDVKDFHGDLMRYYREDDSVRRKVVRAVPTVDEVNGELVGSLWVDTDAPLTAEEQAVFCAYISGQYSDGWGEGFEQREIDVGDGKLYVGCYAPLGYKKSEADKHVLEIDPVTASVVRHIFDLRLQGYGFRKIALQLNAEKVPAPRSFYYMAKGRESLRGETPFWNDVTVKTILRNEVYIGHMVQNKTGTVSYKNHKQVSKPESEWIKVENTHEPLISQETWDAVQRMDNHPARGRSGKSGTIALFGGLLRCMDCGSSMRYMRDYRKKVSEKEPEYKAYVCNRYASGGKNACSSHYINQKVLTQIVMTDIRCKAMWAQNSRETLRTQLLAREQNASAERTRTLQAELNAIGKRLPELDKLIQSAYEDKVLGRIPESVCVNLLNQYEAERREKQERCKELTEQLAASRETESSVDAWLDMMQDYAQLEELDRPTLVRLIQKIEISERYTVDDHEERDIHIYYNFVGYIEA